MEFAKPALTHEEQADLVISRGLLCDRDEFLLRLKSVSYYRLSGYWFPLALVDDTFITGTTLDAVWSRYTFDRQLRLLVLDAIERVEVCVRSELVYRLAHLQGAFGYIDSANMPGLHPDAHARMLEDMKGEYVRSKEQFIEHFRDEHGDEHELPPIWMITEIMTLGGLVKLFRGAPKPVKADIATRFGVTDDVMQNWLMSLNKTRNICAHHGRLWNRKLDYMPMIPKKDLRWHDPVEVKGERVFGTLTVLRYLLEDVAPQSLWTARLEALLGAYTGIPRVSMGFPEGWASCPFWATAEAPTGPTPDMTAESE